MHYKLKPSSLSYIIKPTTLGKHPVLHRGQVLDEWVQPFYNCRHKRCLGKRPSPDARDQEKIKPRERTSSVERPSERRTPAEA